MDKDNRNNRKDNKDCRNNRKNDNVEFARDNDMDMNRKNDKQKKDKCLRKKL